MSNLEIAILRALAALGGEHAGTEVLANINPADRKDNPDAVIYAALNRMSASGLVSWRRQKKIPKIAVYTITEQGAEQLEAADQ